MVGVIENFALGFDRFMQSAPEWLSSSISLFLFALLIAILALFIWKFYKTVSEKNFINLNLRQYNRFAHPGFSKFFATILYLLENVLIMPFFIILWFSGLAIVVLLIAPEKGADQVLLITAAMVAAIRILAYANHEISQDLAKLFPFITLSIFLLSPEEFNLGVFLGELTEVPVLFNSVLFFLAFVFILEIALRLFYSLGALFRSRDEEPNIVETTTAPIRAK